MKDLDSYVKDNAKFLSIQDGKTVTLIYKGFSIIPDRFNPGRETVSYLFQYLDSDKTISWNKSSAKVAIQMNEVAPGETVQITRIGDGMGTKYKIEVI